MRALIADDTPAVRSAIRRLLDEEKNIQVVGEAANLSELIRQVQICQPDLILLDWELSGFPTNARIQFLTAASPTRNEKRRNIILAGLRLCPSQPFIIVLSSHPEAEQYSLEAGADAFVFKGSPPEQLIRTIRTLSSPV